MFIDTRTNTTNTITYTNISITNNERASHNCERETRVVVVVEAEAKEVAVDTLEQLVVVQFARERVESKQEPIAVEIAGEMLVASKQTRRTRASPRRHH